MTDTATQATGIAGAAQAFESLLAGEPDTGTIQDTAAPSQAPAEEAEAFVGETEGDETATVSDEAEVAPESEAAADEEGAEEAQPEVQLVTVTVNGKTEQIPLEEAVKGYQRQADYSRKTAALSEERKAFEAERQSVTTERAQYAQLLTALQQQLQALQPQEPDWQKLYDENPLEYVRQRDVWRETAEKRQAIAFEQQRLQAVQAQEQQQALAKLVQENRAKLTEAVPAWKDAKKWEADRPKLLEYGQKLGFTAEELGQTYDSRAVVALYKAMQYDALMANRPQPTAPKGPKTAPAGSAASAPKAANEVTKAKQRLAKTGKIGDAASLFEAFLD
jgi:hypothetical protein